MKNDSNMFSFNNRREFSKVVWSGILEEASGQMCVQCVHVCVCVSGHNCLGRKNLWANPPVQAKRPPCQITDCSRIAEEPLHEPTDTMHYAVGEDVSTSEFHLNFNEVDLIVFTLEQHLKVQQHRAAHKHTLKPSPDELMQCVWTLLCDCNHPVFLLRSIFTLLWIIILK